MKTVVIGGGIAGLAAATVLTERGGAVTLLEREAFLGGRAGSWADRLRTGEAFEMERGFHAFFRHYKNLRSLLRRVDPGLDNLSPVADYPILGPDGAFESFAGLPRRSPWNIASLAWRTPHLRARDLVGIDAGAALAMLAFDRDATYRKYDGITAAAYLDSLRFPDRARRMLFDVFAHSFFNPEAEMSAAELLMMFHFYFVENRDGLIFDVARRPMGAAFWKPLGDYVTARGADVRLETAAYALERHGQQWHVLIEGGDPIAADAVILALSVPALTELVCRSPDIDDSHLRAQVDTLAVTRPFAVWRLWLDRATAANRSPFVGVTGHGHLDNISLFHLIEDESRTWAAQTGGAVVELHAYACPSGCDPDALRRDLLAGLFALYPETRDARIVEDRFLWRRDCPAFSPGSDASRPGIETRVPGLWLCGDFVRLAAPSALMERAATSGMMAANAALKSHGIAGESVTLFPSRGLLARPTWPRRFSPRTAS